MQPVNRCQIKWLNLPVPLQPNMIKAFKIYALIFLILSSCLSKNDSKNVRIKDNGTESSYSAVEAEELDWVIEGDSITMKAHEGLAQLSYKFNYDSTTHILKSIIVYSDKVKVQEIDVNIMIFTKDFRLVDWNFDGYKDISVLINCGSGGCEYYIWNYSPKTGKYHYNDKLSEVLGLEIDTVLKAIVIHYRAGYEVEYWNTYLYKDDTLSFINGIYQERGSDSLGNSWTKGTYKKIVDDQLVISVDSIPSID